jgi:hypothetical protein
MAKEAVPHPFPNTATPTMRVFRDRFCVTGLLFPETLLVLGLPKVRERRVLRQLTAAALTGQGQTSPYSSGAQGKLSVITILQQPTQRYNAKLSKRGASPATRRHICTLQASISAHLRSPSYSQMPLAAKVSPQSRLPTEDPLRPRPFPTTNSPVPAASPQCRMTISAPTPSRHLPFCPINR